MGIGNALHEAITRIPGRYGNRKIGLLVKADPHPSKNRAGNAKNRSHIDDTNLTTQNNPPVQIDTSS